MTQISNFSEVRADGRTIPSTMTVNDMLAAGWESSKVIMLKWTQEEEPVEIYGKYGVHGIVVPGGNFVAAIYEEGETDKFTKLAILLPDGSIHGELKNSITISTRKIYGCYKWFEPATNPRTNTFGVVFQTENDGDFICDVDANTLCAVSVIRGR